MRDRLLELNKLSAEQRDLLLKKLRQHKRPSATQHSTPLPPLVPAPRDRPLPLSFAQERLWFLYRLDPHSTAYNIPSAIRLTGRLDLAALEHSVTLLIERHEALRTTFALVDDQPVQMINPPTPVALAAIDLRGLAQAEQAGTLQRLIAAESSYIFDLEHGPLIRLSLLRTDDDQHVLIFNLHHIITDGWSMNVLLEELAALYTATSAQTDALPRPALQYADYAVWQRQWLQGAALEKLVSYWQTQLADLAVLELPTDHLRPPFQTDNGASVPVVVSAALSRKLARLGQQAGTTPFMTLLAAFQVLLARYSGQTDFAVGTVTAARTHVAIERLVGFFVNTLVLRADLRDNPTFQEVLRRVRETTLAAYAHQDLPFERVVEALHVERDLSRSPLFQVMFELQSASAPQAVFSALETASLEATNTTAKFDLTLTLQETDSGLQGVFEYNTDLFAASTIQRMVGHLQTLLEAVAHDPARHLLDLPLLTAAERQQMVIDWNSTDTPYPLDRGFLSLFADQVARTPGAIAIIDSEQHLSYQELSSRALRLAAALAAAGVTRGMIVPVLAERGADLITAIVAIFAAGGAYLPLDPTHPPQRLRQGLEQSRCDLVLATRSCRALLRTYQADGLASPTVLVFEELLVARPSVQPYMPPTLDTNDLAYALFTSGSTGTPKAVLIEHGAMLNHLLLMVEQLELSQADMLAQTASQCFDISVWQMLTPLLVGGRVVVLDNTTARDPQALVAAVGQYGITVLQIVPSLLAVMVEAVGETLPADPLSGLRWLIPTGEALPPMLAQRWLRRYPHVPLINAYGPAECADDVTLGRITTPPSDDTAHTTIGSPVQNMQVYVLDRRGDPVPVGVIGELFIGGIGVGRGYLHDARRTAQVFVPDPFSRRAGARLYRTGDLARYRGEQALEFVGRVDQQVKIRGYRIELGEVEAVINQHPAVRECVVLAREDQPGDLRLVAYLTFESTDGAALDGSDVPSELRTFAQARLPGYMVPAAFVLLQALPLTANAKIDRRALPVPDAHAYGRSTAGRQPHTPIEAAIAEIWARVLQLDTLTVDDNFFTLGGHSLLATQVISRLQATFQINLSLRTFFEKPTIAELAAEIAAQQVQPADLLPPIVPVGRHQPLPLSFSQQRLWFLNEFEPGTPAYNMVNSVYLTGDVQLPVLRATLNMIVQRHESLRTIFAAQDGRPVQIIQPPVDAALTVVNLQSLSQAEREAEIRAIMATETHHSFDLTRGPLFRSTLIQVAADRAILCLNVHHIVSDGWSESILFQELVTLYHAFQTGQPAPLPELTIHYADYAFWQQQLLQGDYLERQLAYWRQQLGDDSKPLNLPIDHPRPPIRTSAGATQPCNIDRELLDGLKRLAEAAQVSLYMVILAALQTWLYRYTHDTQISVGTYIANRHHRAVESLIGFFVNTLVLRTDVQGSPTFRELLGRVRDVALGAYAHQDVPFEKLLEELQPVRDLSRTPFFQVMLVLQNTPEGSLDLPGLTIEPLDLDGDIHAHFDMTLWLDEQQDGMGGSLEYNSDLFDRSTIARMSAHLIMLLRRVVADPDQTIDAIDMLSPTERASLLQLSHDRQQHDAPAQSVQTLIEYWAEQTPQAVAIVWEDQQISYSTLDQRATLLAHALHDVGVGPDVRVGICVERSPDMIISVLGVLKAGGAYVPLDPGYPPERIAFMLHDSCSRVLITRGDARLVPPGADMPVLDLDTLQRRPACDGQRPLICAAAGNNLAYVVYTSGSTDVPKGVMVERSSLLHAYNGWHEAYDLRPGMRHLQMASFSFDVFAGDLVRALCSGGTLVICPRELLLDPAALYRLIQQHRPMCGEFVPAVIRELLRYVKETAQPLDGLERLIVGSDLWYMHEYQQLRDLCAPTTRLINSYGLSEATIDSTYFEHSSLALSSDKVVPIGRPFKHTCIYILDQRLEPVPVGVIGELYISGVGLARGYQNQAARTALQFQPDPWAGLSGARMYRTGDQARWLADGNIEFLGRNDDQVKVRGFRIELGEVQTVLGQHPSVEEALVTVGKDTLANNQLIAYVVIRHDHELHDQALRSYLKERLPEYMLPAAFVPLATFPLTPNGKLDRQALPLPDLSARRLEHLVVQPRDAIELQLVDIWESLLGISPIGVKDNFFDLGGHSLLAVHLMAQIQRRLNKQLPLMALFQGATVEHLADMVRRDTDSPGWSPLVAMQTRGTKLPLFCVPGAGGNVIGFYPLARRLGTDRPVYGLQARGLADEAKPHSSIEAMAAAYVEAIQSVQPTGPYFLCGHSFGGWVAYEIAQQLQRQDQEIGLLAIFNTPTPMVMRADPAAAGHAQPEPQDAVATMLAVVGSIERTFDTALDVSGERLRQLSADAQIDYLTEQLKRADILPATADTKQVRGFVHVFKANYDITYIPQDYQPTRIVLFRAGEQHAEDGDVPPSIRHDPAWGWNELASSPVALHVTSGEHLSMLQEPHVQSLVEQLERYLP